MSLFLKIVTSDFKNESRDMRELSVVSTFDTDIIIVAKGELNTITDYNGYTIHRRTTRPLGDIKWLIKTNRRLSVFTWAYYTRRIQPNYISCHDLVALLIGWLSTWFLPRNKKPILIYDAHEFEMGRNTGGKRRGAVVKWVISKLEKFLINKCAFSIMVNDSIADEVQKIYKLKTRPVVVRNIPPNWPVDEDVCRIRRREICRELEIADDPFILMYHGGIMPGRGIEHLLVAVQRTIGTAAVILGYGKGVYLEKLRRQVEQLKIDNRILFHAAVPIDILWQYIGAVDVGMVTIPPVTKSYYLMLPNKFFENIQALTPVIGSDFPEIRRIINNYDIGLVVNPENIDDIVRTIQKLKNDKKLHAKFKRNLKKAKKELCWEKESIILENAYRKVLGKPFEQDNMYLRR